MQRPNLRRMRPFLSAFLRCRSAASPGPASSTSTWPKSAAEGSGRGFFEVHAENYMGAGGPPHRALETLRRDFPISLHGVCMSIGGERPLDRAHLARFQHLVERYEPALVSEHLAWSTPRDHLFQRSFAVALHRDDAPPGLRPHRPGSRGDPPADAARKPVDLCCVSRVDDERNRFHPQRFAAHRMRPAARRQQRLRVRHQPRLLGTRLFVRLSPGRCRRDSSRRSCRTIRRRGRTAVDRQP